MASLLDKLIRKKTTEIAPFGIQNTPEETAAAALVYKRLAETKNEADYNNAEWTEALDYVNGQHPILTDERRGPNNSRVVKNYAKPIVDKFSDFFIADGVKVFVPRDRTIDSEFALTPEIEPEEIKRGFQDELNNASIKQKMLDAVLYDDNDWDGEMTELSHLLFTYGNAIIQSKVIDGRVVISVLNPTNVRTIWSGDDYRRLEGTIYIARRSVSDVERQYGIEVPKEARFNYTGEERNDPSSSERDKQFTNVIDYEDAEVEVVIAGGRVVSRREKDGDLQFVNRIHIGTNKLPGSPYGQPFLKQAYPLFDQLNEIASIKQDLIRYAPNNIIIAEGLSSAFDPKRDFKAGSTLKMLRVPTGARVYPLELAKPLFSLDQEEQQLLETIRDVLAMPAIAFGNVDASLATGIALTTSFAPTAQRLKSVGRDVNVGLRQLFENIFKQIKSLDSFAAGIIQENYNVEVKFGTMTPRDESLHIQNTGNLVNTKMISLQTAMKRIGIDNPRDEVIQIAHENTDKSLHPENAAQMIASQVQVEQLELQKQQLEMQKKQAEMQQSIGSAPTRPGQQGPIPGTGGQDLALPPFFNSGEFNGLQSVQGASATGGGSPLPL